MAATDTLLTIDGIRGESRQYNHPGAIDVESWSWGALNSGNAELGGGPGPGKVGDLNFLKHSDRTSPALIRAWAAGTPLTSAVLLVRKADGSGLPLEFLTVTMTNVRVAHFGETGSSGSQLRGTESVSLSFTKVRVEYKERLADGSVVTTSSRTWNVASNAKE